MLLSVIQIRTLAPRMFPKVSLGYVCVLVLHPTRVSLSVKNIEGVLSLSLTNFCLFLALTFVAHYSFPFVSCTLRMAKSIVPLSAVLKKKTMPPCEPLVVRVVRVDPWPVNPIRINPALAFVPTRRDTLVWSNKLEKPWSSDALLMLIPSDLRWHFSILDTG